MELVVLILLGSANALWQAVYTPNLTRGYIETQNGTLLALDVSKTSSTAAQVGKAFHELAPAPSNSTLVVDGNGELLAVWGSECDASPIQISRYDGSRDRWTSVAQSGSPYLFHTGSTVWYSSDGNAVYIYGGECNGTPHNNFYAWNVTTHEFSTLHPSLMPREMAEASTIALNERQTLVIGGHASSGWMSMQQVALWEYGSWTFTSVGNSANIDSRDSPLLLPLWELGADTLSGVLVVGGTVSGRAANPPVALLSLNDTEGWTWQDTKVDIDTTNNMAASLYETFARVDQTGTVSLYNGLQHFARSHSAAVPQATGSSIPDPGDSQNGKTPSKSGGGVSTAVIAVMSTLFPLIAIVAAVLGVWWWWRRKVQNRTFRPRSHNFGHMSENPLAGYPVGYPPMPSPRSVGTSQRAVQNRRGSNGGDSYHDHDSVLDVGRQDVQILVSQSRRELRVMNPDSDLISFDSNTADSSSVRTTGRDPFEDPQDEDFDFGVDDEPRPRQASIRRRVTP